MSAKCLVRVICAISDQNLDRRASRCSLLRGKMVFILTSTFFYKHVHPNRVHSNRSERFDNFPFKNKRIYHKWTNIQNLKESVNSIYYRHNTIKSYLSSQVLSNGCRWVHARQVQTRQLIRQYCEWRRQGASVMLQQSAIHMNLSNARILI